MSRMTKHNSDPTGYGLPPAQAPADPGSLFAPIPPRALPPSSPPAPRDPMTDPRDTSTLAGEMAARISGGRRKRILQLLANDGPATLFELCAAFGCQEHQISGRISEFKAEGLIDSIGRRPHPRSGCPCEVYEINDRGRDELRKIKGR